MILISDSGSTKTDWVFLDEGAVHLQIKTQGLNPTQQTSERITEILREELIPQLPGESPLKIYFYGAGCAYAEANSRIRKALETIFPDTAEIEINSDLLAAARALCGNDEGIACILGTG